MRKTFFHKTDGQIILWLAFGVAVLILFTGIAVDMGLIYMTKARLSNAVDSAVLTAAKNYSAGTPTAQGYGEDMFAANFGANCSASSPTCTWTWCPGGPGCTGSAISATLKATTSLNTNFLGYLPALRVWSLSDTGAATRSTLVMTIVLDRSGSMGPDGGMAALKSAVPTFVGDFTPNVDYIGMVSFASHSSIDAPISTNFVTKIDNAIAAMQPNGGTFGTGAGSGPVYSATNGPPLSLADAQNNSIVLPPTQPETKVVVYFTDGLMNAIQDQFNCPAQTLVNYGGYDPPGTQIASLDPFSENIWGCYAQNGDNGCQTKGLQYDAAGDVCTGPNGPVTTFPSQEFGGPVAISRANVTEEADWRGKYTAAQMRKESPIPTYIYSIGLGTDVSTQPCTEALLSTIANDPSGPANYNCPAHPAVYDSTLPAGLFLVVPSCPGAQCTQELNTAFQTIASKILLRLSQ